MTAISSALDQAKAFADGFIKPQNANQSSAPESDHHHHYYHSYHPCWYNCHSSSLFLSPGGKGGKKDNTGAIVVLAGLIILATGYFLGKDIGKWSNVNGSQQNLNDHKLAVQETNHPAKEKVIKVLNFQDDMLNALKSEAKTGFALKSLMIASAALAIAGVCTDRSTLLVGGASGAAVTGLASLFRSGYSSSNTLHQENANRLYLLAQATEY